MKIPGNLFLAPLAGYSDAAFRSICLQWGADLCYTEMVSAEGIIRDNEKTLDLLKRAENERLLAVQIFAASEQSAARAVRRLEAYKPDLYDLNCGCSVAKVLKSGCGAALLRDPPLIGRIVAAMCAETDRPVTVKLRSGWDHDSINYLQCGQAAQLAGAAMICLHPRTRSQGFCGRARRAHIRELKTRCEVPVIASGDLFTAQQARGTFEETGCDALMFARGALGNPFIFSDSKRHLGAEKSTRRITPPLALRTALQQLDLAVRYKGEQTACREMRKVFCHYSKGFAGGAQLRARLVRAETLQQYRDIVGGFLASNHFK